MKLPVLHFLSDSIPILAGLALLWSQCLARADDWTMAASRLPDSNAFLDFGLRVATDTQGDVYVTGDRFDAANTNNPPHVFVSKFSPDLQTEIYNVTLGGSGGELAGNIAVDTVGNAYVVGTTTSPDFPGISPYLQYKLRGTSDAFVVKLDPNGSSVYATYLGGSSQEFGLGISVDGSGGAYVTGMTTSSDFLAPIAKDAPWPTNAYQSELHGDSDAFLVKIDPAGDKFDYKTYLGGWDDSYYPSFGVFNPDAGVAVAADEGGSAYVFGLASSDDFPVTNAAQANFGGSADAFIAKFNPQGGLDFSTFLGGSGKEIQALKVSLGTMGLFAAGDIAVDAEHNIYVVGDTASDDFPVTNAFQTELKGSEDVFVAKLAANGSAFQYATLLGGTTGSVDLGLGIAVNKAGNAFVTGITDSSDFPVSTNAIQTALAGQSDAFFAELSPAGNALDYATLLGGSSGDTGNGITLDPAGNIILTGWTSSTNFPVTGTRPSGKQTLFVTKLAAVGNAGATFVSYGFNAKKQFVLTIRAPQSRTYQLESSSDLSVWKTVTSFQTGANGTFQFTGSQGAQRAAMFYRVVAP